MNSLLTRFFAFLFLVFCLLNSPFKAEAAVNIFPMDGMVNLLNIRFEGRTLKQIYLRNPGQANLAIQCKTSRVVVNFPPKAQEATLVVGQVVWFDALSFVTDSMTLNKPIFVKNDIRCILTSDINLLQYWLTNFRYLPQSPFNQYWQTNNRDFIYYVNFGDQLIYQRTVGNWCRARSVGNVNTNKIFYNAVFMLNDINSYKLTYTSIDLYCTYDNRWVNIWLRNGWKIYRYT